MFPPPPGEIHNAGIEPRSPALQANSLPWGHQGSSTVHIIFPKYLIVGGVVLRWQRTKTGRPLSPPQIHWKIIWTLSKYHKTTSECWWRTPGTPKGSLLSLKGGKTKDKKRDKRVRDGDPSQEGSSKRGEVSKLQETLSLCICGEFWHLRGQHNLEEKNK